MTTHVVNASAGTVTINGGTFVGPKGTASDSGTTVNAQGTAAVTINGGSFTNALNGGADEAVSASGDGSISITGGTFDKDVTAYVAEGYVLNPDGSVAKLVAGTITTGYTEQTSDRSRIFGEIYDLSASESVVIELYSGETLLATTTLTNESYITSKTLTYGIVIGGRASSSWNTVWEEGHPVANVVPDKVVLYVDGTQMNSATVTMGKPDNLGTPAVWAELQGVAAPVYPAYIGETGYESLEAALNAAKASGTATTITLKAGEHALVCGTMSEGRYWLPADLTIIGEDGAVITNEPAFSAKNLTVKNVDFVGSSYVAMQFHTSGDSLFEDCTIEGPNGTYYSTVSNGTTTFKNCTVSGLVYGLHVGEGNGSVVIENCDVTGWNSYGVTGTVTITDSQLHKSDYGQLRFYQTATITNTTIDSDVAIDADDGNTITFTGCKTEEGKSIVGLIDADTIDTVTYIVDGATLKTLKFENGAILDQGEKIRITIELQNAIGVETLEVKLYDTEGNLLTTVTPEVDGIIVDGMIGATTVNIMIKGNSSSWQQTDWTPSKDQLPDSIELVINGEVVATSDVVGDAVTGTGHSLTQAEWEALLAKAYPVAEVNGVKYGTLQEALDAAKGDKNIVVNLLADATLDIAAWQPLAIGGETTETKLTIEGNTAYVSGNGFALAQNNSRNNAYAVDVKDNTFIGTDADYIWIEATGNVAINAKVNATGNKVGEDALTAAQIKIDSTDTLAATGYAGVDVETNEEGKLIGGTFTGFTSKENVAESYTAIDNDDGTWTIGGGVAQNVQTGKIYSNVSDALKDAQSGETIILLCDATGDGLKIDKSVTIDLGGYTYTLETSVGSSNTATNGMQILSGNTVVIKNGTLAMVEDEMGDNNTFFRMIMTYADLTLEDVVLDCTNGVWSNGSDVGFAAVSVASGKTTFTGSTSIANCEFEGSKETCAILVYGSATATVDTTGTV